MYYKSKKEYSTTLYNEVEIEGIKLAAYNLEGVGVSSKDILLRSITWLKENYERFHQPELLEKAVWHIYAYLGPGYPYEEGEPGGENS